MTRRNKQLRILLVEGNLEVLDVLKDLLKTLRKNVDIDTAWDGDEAFTLYCQRGPYDLVLTGDILRGLSGIDFVKAIRKECPTQPIAVLTFEKEIRQTLWEKFKIPSLRKPAAMEEIDKLLRSVSVDRQAAVPSVRVSTAVAPSRKTIFIVHGHDHELLRELELQLHRWKLKPVVLSEQPNRGMTLLEKVEANTEVGFAFVLLTPDDYGGTDIGRLQRRARQNVIWEWGYLVAKLGRDRVCCLCKDEVEIPSDLNGIVRIVVTKNLKENLEEIRRELKEAGFDIRP